jgi:hypothetical protein
MLDDLAADRAAGTIPSGPNGSPVSAVYLNGSGHDLKQLIQKFLLGAVNFSQAADDYLSHDVSGKGLNSSNVRDGEKAYTKLQHAYDEAFGYYGAMRNMLDFTAAENKAAPYHDANQDGEIDLKSEFNFGHSMNAVKRDVGSLSNTNPTNFTTVIFDAFIAGRKIIHEANDNGTPRELTSEEMDALKAQRDIIVLNWEKAIAATVVHYINDVLGDMDKIGTEEYKYSDHAKHWGELKGFALCFQFNPASPLSSTKFVEFHTKIGDAPVLTGTSEIQDYKITLVAARDILKEAYSFNSENVENW